MSNTFNDSVFEDLSQVLSSQVIMDELNYLIKGEEIHSILSNIKVRISGSILFATENQNRIKCCISNFRLIFLEEINNSQFSITNNNRKLNNNEEAVSQIIISEQQQKKNNEEVTIFNLFTNNNNNSTNSQNVVTNSPNNNNTEGVVDYLQNENNNTPSSPSSLSSPSSPSSHIKNEEYVIECNNNNEKKEELSIFQKIKKRTLKRSDKTKIEESLQHIDDSNQNRRVIHSVALCIINSVKERKKKILEIQTKDGINLLIYFFKQSELTDSLNFLTNYLFCQSSPSSLSLSQQFAFLHLKSISTARKFAVPFNLLDEYKRIITKSKTKNVQISEINEKYEICETYPTHVLITKNIKNEQIQASAKYRTKNRFPVISWIHPKKKTHLLRSSQPKVGVQRERSTEDEQYLSQLKHDQLKKLYIIDTRLRSNAVANMLRGGGFENLKNYKDCEFEFHNIENFKSIQSSLLALYRLCVNITSSDDLKYVTSSSSSFSPSSSPSLLHSFQSSSSSSSRHDDGGDGGDGGDDEGHDRVGDGDCVHTTRDQNDDNHDRQKNENNDNDNDDNNDNDNDNDDDDISFNRHLKNDDDEDDDDDKMKNQAINESTMTTTTTTHVDDDHNNEEEKNKLVEKKMVKQIYQEIKEELLLSLDVFKDISQIEFNVEQTKWLLHLRLILESSQRIVTLLHLQSHSVLVHCSSSFDRTTQVVCTVQVMSDPYYRTIEGFLMLIEKEWIQFAHQFAYRTHRDKNNDYTTQEKRSPIFLQWLDVIHQLIILFPSYFEFDDQLLIHLLEELYSNQFGAFLFNSMKERSIFDDLEITSQFITSFWFSILENREKWVNYQFKPKKRPIIFENLSSIRLQLWSSLFLRYKSPTIQSIPIFERKFDDNNNNVNFDDSNPFARKKKKHVTTPTISRRSTLDSSSQRPQFINNNNNNNNSIPQRNKTSNDASKKKFKDGENLTKFMRSFPSGRISRSLVHEEETKKTFDLKLIKKL